MNQQNERTTHGPQLLTVTRLGNPQYGAAWAFGEIEGFYKAPRDQPNMQLNVGTQWMVTWTVKDNSPNRPYLDIVSAVLPDGQVARYDPQGNMVPGPAGPVVTPEQTADWATNPPGADYYNEAADNPNYGDHIDPPAPPKRDATRESIEVQVFVKECGSMLQVLAAHGTTDLFTPEQVDWLRQNWFDGLYELKHGTPPPAPAEAEEETA